MTPRGQNGPELYEWEKAEKVLAASWTSADIAKLHFPDAIATICILWGFFSA